MLDQTFSLVDIPRVGALAFLEILLSADNAIVLGLIASRLSPSLRKRALYIGFISAWIFRFIGILGISFLLEYSWIQFVGGLYLLYLSVHHFIKNKKKDPTTPHVLMGFWKTVLMIEFFDLAFAIDSIIAGVAFIGTSSQHMTLHPKIWIVYIGGMIGVFVIRYAAHFFSSMIHHFPRLEKAAYGMIGWIGLKLGLQSLSLTFPHYEVVFWAVLFILFLIGMTKRKNDG